MVVPIYKRMEASLARMQILQRETVVQLTVFMEDFSLGRSMNFVLKGTDELESFARSGKFYIRFVDAKFAMPKSQKELGGEFVCLDTPEYPGEHDDIVIGFDSEEGTLFLILLLDVPCLWNKCVCVGFRANAAG